jgi:hypothetical protein
VLFRVNTADQSEWTHHGTYTVLDSGALVIRPDDGSKPIITLSPAYWHQISGPPALYDEDVMVKVAWDDGLPQGS